MDSNQSAYVFRRELAFLLVDAGRKLNDAYDTKMKPLALTRSQWRVMAYVSRTPGISQTELAASVECSRMAITSLLDRMQVKDLVERREFKGDRRVRSVYLTSKGEALVRGMNRTAGQVLKEVFANISEEEISQLQKILQTIKVNAGGLVEL